MAIVGHFADGQIVTADDLNNALLQVGTAAARPAAGVLGRIYWATDTFVLSRDNGTTWDDIIPADTNTASQTLRKLGTASTDAAAGDHTHTLAEEGSGLAVNPGTLATPALGADVTGSGGTRNSLSASVTTDETTRVCAVGTFGLEGAATPFWDIILTVDGVTVDSATGVNSSDGMQVLKGSRVTTTNTAVSCLATATNQGALARAAIIACGGVGVSI